MKYLDILRGIMVSGTFLFDHWLTSMFPAFLLVVVFDQPVDIDRGAFGWAVWDRLVEKTGRKSIFFRAQAFAQVEVALDLADMRTNLPEIALSDFFTPSSPPHQGRGMYSR